MQQSLMQREWIKDFDGIGVNVTAQLSLTSSKT